MYRRLVIAAVAASIFVVLLSGVAGAVSLPPSPPSSLAIVGGSEQLDLSLGWGDAHACLVFGGAVECFRDRAGLLAREAEIETQIVVVPSIAAASCSSPLRLFADGSYGGRELDFYDRGYWQNLSTWSFDNQLSSYQVGACSVYLADGADGGGSWYPGNTNAGHNEPGMSSGWNDRISSIYIQ